MHTVASGEALLAPAVTRRVIERFAALPAGRADLAAQISRSSPPGSRRCSACWGVGLTNAEIADELVISEGTVKTHVAHVLAKLGLRDRVQAVIFAYESGLDRTPRARRLKPASVGASDGSGWVHDQHR